MVVLAGSSARSVTLASGYRVLMDLPHLGEFSSRVVKAFAAHKGIAVEDEDIMPLAKIVWDELSEMLDRADFARSVGNDLNAIAEF